MATFAKQTLSGSTDGRPVLVAATTIGAGTTIHTGSSTATTFDEIWLYAANSSTSAVKLTVGWGGTTDPNDLIEITLTGESGLVLIAPGLVLKGNATPLVVRASAGTASVITLHGYVNRITA
jgi:hypothetical protein